MKLVQSKVIFEINQKEAKALNIVRDMIDEIYEQTGICIGKILEDCDCGEDFRETMYENNSFALRVGDYDEF